MQSLSVLIPAHNEEEVIEKNVLDLKDYLDNLKSISSYEIIVCINASTDKTEEICSRLSGLFNEIGFSSIEQKGIGVALRYGINLASKDLIAWLPADGEINLDFLDKSVEALKDNDFVSASRYIVNTTHGSGILRSFLSIGFSCMIRVLLCWRLTEVGTVKAFTRVWAQAVVDELKCDKADSQVEILYYALYDNLKIKEVPVTVTIKRDSDESKINIPSETMSYFLTTLKLGFLLKCNKLFRFFTRSVNR